MAEKKDLIKPIEIVFLFILMVFTAIFRMQSTHIPLDLSEGAFAYGATQMQHGVVPYKDFFEHRPPIILYVYKTAFSLLGNSVESLRLFTTFYCIASMLLIYIFARTVWRCAFTAMLAAFFYVCYQHSFIFQGLSANTAIYAQLPIVASLLFAADRDVKYAPVNFCVSGFFAATALLTHLAAFFFVFVPAAYILFYTEKHRLKNMLWFLTGYAAVLAATALWALFNKSFIDMYTGVVVYNLALLKRYAAGAMPVAPFNWMPVIFQANIIPFIAVIYSAVMLFLRKKDGINFLLFSGAASLCLGILFSKTVNPHYFLVLAPLAAFLSAVLVRDMYVLLSRDMEIRKYAWIILAMFLVLNTAVLAKINRIGDFLRNNIYTEEIFYEERAMAQAVMSYGAGPAKKDNYIFAYPDMPGVYYYAGLKSASRYAYTYPLGYFTKDKQKATDAMVQDRAPWVIVQKDWYGDYMNFLNDYYGKIAESKNLVLYRNLHFQ